MITHKKLLELVKYEPETGIFTKLKTGKRLGHIGRPWHRAGPCRRFRLGGLTKSAAAWAHFYMTGRWSNLVDHINGDSLDDKWGNLRAATTAQNNANKRCYRSNKLGLKGVHFHRGAGRYRAQAMKNGRRISLGLFDTAAEAHAAYVEKSKELHGDFARAA